MTEGAVTERSEGRAYHFAIRLLERLQAEYSAVHGPEYFGEFPDARQPCASCAIQPYGNKAKGQDRTALTFFAALASGQAFLCHKGASYEKGKGWAVDTVNGPLCVAYWAMVGIDRKTLWTAFREAMEAEFGLLGDIDEDDALDLITSQLLERLA